MTKIFLDAGHGGTDSGALGNNLLEKNLTLEIIQQINDKLKNYKNVETMLARNTDVFVGLDERASMSNKWGSDVFLSVHINAATDTGARGWQSHIYSGSTDEKTTAFQNVIHSEVINAIKKFGITDRGKERNNFAVLRETTCPAILTENLFITNSADAKLLNSSEFIDTVADGHVNGLAKFLGLERSLPPPLTNPTSDLYYVVAGTFANLDNAKSLTEKLKKDGYESQIVKK
jgi:N-acetylmuramoyl-L-alanine amidase